VSLKRKQINDIVVLWYGAIKDDGVPSVRGTEGAEALQKLESDGGEGGKEVSLQTLPTELYQKTEGTSSGPVCSGV
jgi:hypothetical protein